MNQWARARRNQNWLNRAAIYAEIIALHCGVSTGPIEQTFDKKRATGLMQTTLMERYSAQFIFCAQNFVPAYQGFPQTTIWVTK